VKHVAMDLPEGSERNIQLGLAGRDEAGRYSLCRLEGVAVEQSSGVIYQQSFESTDHGWHCTRGLDSAVSREGTSSLHLSGRQARGWNYISHALDAAILPASRYRLSCWLKVGSVEPSGPAPYLKIGLVDAEGDWIENHPTSTYDMNRTGQWQRLEAALETSLETVDGHLALERGSNDTATRIDLWLDDVRLELLEAP